MSYRLIDSNAIANKYPEVNDMPCVYADLQNGLDGSFITQQWIPVTERLPEEETDVLVCNANGEIQISSGSYSTEMKDCFIWYTTGWRFGKVVAWMPLPEPWKGESDETH